MLILGDCGRLSSLSNIFKTPDSHCLQNVKNRCYDKIGDFQTHYLMQIIQHLAIGFKFGKICLMIKARNRPCIFVYLFSWESYWIKAAGWKQPYPGETTHQRPDVQKHHLGAAEKFDSLHTAQWAYKVCNLYNSVTSVIANQRPNHGSVPKCCCSSILAFMWDYFEKLRSPSSKNLGSMQIFVRAAFLAFSQD